MIKKMKFKKNIINFKKFKIFQKKILFNIHNSIILYKIIKPKKIKTKSYFLL